MDLVQRLTVLDTRMGIKQGELAVTRRFIQAARTKLRMGVAENVILAELANKGIEA